MARRNSVLSFLMAVAIATLLLLALRISVEDQLTHAAHATQLEKSHHSFEDTDSTQKSSSPDSSTTSSPDNNDLTSIEELQDGPEPYVTRDCVIPVYAPYNYEFKWILDVLVSQVPRHCDCAIRLLDAEDMARDFRAWATQEPNDGSDDTDGVVVDEPPYEFAIVVVLLNLDGGIRELLETSEKFREYASTRAVMVHMSDEGEWADTSFYPKFKATYRNYLSLKPERKTSLNYLKRPSVPDEEDMLAYWFPLGYSTSFLASPHIISPLKFRPKLYFWAGSSGGKHERGIFLESIRSNQTLVQRGFLHEYGGFQANLGSSDLIQPIGYTRLMYEARVVPCPAGGSPDQFRISETLESGAIVMIKKGHAHLAFMDELGFKYIGLDEWTQAREMLEKVDGDREYFEELGEWAEQNVNRWQQLKFDFASHLAQRVCSL